MNITNKFYCSKCKQWLDKPTGTVGIGYATYRTKKLNKVCYACCAIGDKEWMDEHGKITLYLSIKEREEVSTYPIYIISNWPNTLQFKVLSFTTGRHNIAGKRYDVTFRDHNNSLWYGTQYGDNTQLVHCRRYKTNDVNGKGKEIKGKT